MRRTRIAIVAGVLALVALAGCKVPPEGYKLFVTPGGSSLFLYLDPTITQQMAYVYRYTCNRGTDCLRAYFYNTVKFQGANGLYAEIAFNRGVNETLGSLASTLNVIAGTGSQPIAAHVCLQLYINDGLGIIDWDPQTDSDCLSMDPGPAFIDPNTVH